MKQIINTAIIAIFASTCSLIDAATYTVKNNSALEIGVGFLKSNDKSAGSVRVEPGETRTKNIGILDGSVCTIRVVTPELTDATGKVIRKEKQLATPHKFSTAGLFKTGCNTLSDKLITFTQLEERLSAEDAYKYGKFKLTVVNTPKSK